MPDNLLSSGIEKHQKVSETTGEDGMINKLQREAELLRGGVVMGVSHRLERPDELLRDATISLVAGYALKSALDAGGRWGTAAKVAGGILAIGAAGDMARRAVPTVGAIKDTWNSPHNSEYNKIVVANNLGTALVDYPVMGAAGYAGFKLAGSSRFSLVADPDKYACRGLPPVPAESLKSVNGPATEALLKSSIPINVDTRAAAQRLSASLPATDALLNSGVPINADSRAAVLRLSEANSLAHPRELRTLIERELGPRQLQGELARPLSAPEIAAQLKSFEAGNQVAGSARTLSEAGIKLRDWSQLKVLPTEGLSGPLIKDPSVLNRPVLPPSLREASMGGRNGSNSQFEWTKSELPPSRLTGRIPGVIEAVDFSQFNLNTRAYDMTVIGRSRSFLVPPIVPVDLKTGISYDLKNATKASDEAAAAATMSVLSGAAAVGALEAFRKH
ncbi:MAG: hypothetical protein K2X27_16620 [Candidatus Obscuribacterales bacterium]|nr:hypothetical protein [Candidatus Obscuribacterales bacterium]